jgi:hypothetical protein
MFTILIDFSLNKFSLELWLSLRLFKIEFCGILEKLNFMDAGFELENVFFEGPKLI